MGQDSQSGSANKGDTDNYIESQRQIVQSDAVLRPVVEKFHLQAASQEFQLKRARRRVARAQRCSDPSWHSGLTVQRAGRIRAMLAITYQSPDPERAADVANEIAKSYQDRTRWTSRIHSSITLSKFMKDELATLQDKTTASEEKVASLEKELKIINPDLKTSLASAELGPVATQYTAVQMKQVEAEAAYAALSAE